MSRTKGLSVRLKLFLVMVFTLVVVVGGLLLLVVRANDDMMQGRQAELEKQIRQTLAEKGRILASNHAIALGPLVADNAFTDVRKMVETTVSEDSDILYGLFLSEAGRPWAYVSPTHPAEEGATIDLESWKELGITKLSAREREKSLFGARLYEFSAPVSVDGETLGTIRYGFGDGRLAAALEHSRKAAEAEKVRLLKTVGGLVAVVLALAIFAIFRVSRRLTAPLDLLTRAAESIANGNRSERVRIHSGDEMELLAEAFNKMLDKNERQFVQLERTTEEALAASRLKSEFLANMSHEIRTPMNGVLGMVKLILRRPLDEKVRRYAETVEASANGLMTIINDILDFSKMEAGKYTLQSASFEPRTVVQETSELLSGKATESGIELVYRVNPSFPKRLVGDPDRFRQVLNNLVGNAVKFTQEGEVFIDVDHEMTPENQVRCIVRVVDTGVGISQDAIETLFDAFTQADGSRIRQHGGTGLGLTISKRLVKMMGGDISVRSTPGEGSVFTVTFLFDLDEAEPERPSLAWTIGRRVAVVEANKRWSSIVIEHLDAWGLKSEVFESTSTALEKIKDCASREEPFDIVLLGLQVHDEEGVAFVATLRKDPQTKETPIVALTQLGSSATLSEIEKELAAQISKPLRASDLFNTLQSTLVGDVEGLKEASSKEPVEFLKSRAPILIVDDNEINQLVAVEAIEMEGYRTDVANHGVEALEKLESGEYLLVLMDCQMPVMDGLEATRRIREKEKREGGHIPIIALTAHAMAGERERVLNAGMDDFLTKPFHPDSLRRMIERHGLRVEKERLSNLEGENAPGGVSGSEEQPLKLGVKRSRRLIELSLINLPSQVALLRKAVESRDVAEVKEHSHKLKGGCLALMAGPMARAAERLQRASGGDDLSDADALMLELDRLFVPLRAALDEELKSKKES